MKKMPKISVILTSFNHEKYIRESIDSVLRQSFTDLELLILDDASSDNSWTIINSYSDERIKLFRSQVNGEISPLIEKVIREHATGEYIAIHHSDDVWELEKLAKQMAYIDERPEIGAVFTWVQVIDETGTRVENDWFNRGNQPRWAWLRELFDEKNTLNHPSSLIRRSCYDEIGGYRYGLGQIDDAEFWSRLVLRHPIHVLEEKLTLHRLFSDNSNVSGDRPDVAVRSSHEWNFLRKNLLALRSFDEVVQVFPELERWRHPKGFNVKFLVAMACVQSPHRSAWVLGLQWLFELLNDTAQQNQLVELYAFTDFSLIKLSATLDSFRVEATKQHQRDLAEYEARIQGALSEYAALRGVLAERDILLKDSLSEYASNVQRLQEDYVEASHRTQATHQEALSALEAKVEELRLTHLEKDQAVSEARQLAEAQCALAATESRRADTALERAEAERARAEATQTLVEAAEARAASAQDLAEAAEARATSAQNLAEAAKARAEAAEVSAVAAEAGAAAAQYRAEAAEARAEAERGKAEAAKNRAEAEHARADATQSSAQAERIRADAAEQEATWQRQQAQNASMQRESVAARLAAVESSSSWRATAPVRRFLASRPRAARAVRRAAKLIWWSATLQLPKKIGEWRARRYAARPAAIERVPAPADAEVIDLGLAPPELAASAPRPVGTTIGEWAAQLDVLKARATLLLAPGSHAERYFQNLGFDDAAAAAWARLITARQADLEAGDVEKAAASLDANAYFQTLADKLCPNPLFDPAFYGERANLRAAERDLAVHYLLLGEPLGLAPSASFDVAYYFKCQSDIAAAAMNCLLHYISDGHRENRRPRPPAVRRTARPELMDPQRENVIVVVHETSRTGAPILGWNIAKLLSRRYNVFTVLLGEGALAPEFEALSVESHGPFEGGRPTPIDAEAGLSPLFEGRVFKYAIVNSIESRAAVQVCATRFVPTLLLVHEFGTYVWPADSLRKALDTASEVVFPAPLVARSSLEVHPALQARGFHIEPQGMSKLPESEVTPKLPAPERMQRLAELRKEGALIVMGAGSVNLRKGVDLFIAVAAAVKHLQLKRRVHFMWIGEGYRPTEDMGYSIYLKEQLSRSGLDADLSFLDEVSDLEPIYGLADVFLLASRLDPLPNVSIDAVHRGIPTVCFKNASGTADLLLENPETAAGVVEHLDIHAAAEVIGRLAMNEPARAQMADATKRFAAATFNMERYVHRLDELGAARSMNLLQQHRLGRLAPSSVWFDAQWYAAQVGGTTDGAHTHFLTAGATQGRFPSALVEHVVQTLGAGPLSIMETYSALSAVSSAWPSEVPPSAIRLLVSVFVPEWHEGAGTPLERFLAYLRGGMLADVAPGPLFDADTYRQRAAAAGLPSFEAQESAMLHWLLHGYTARIVPTERFDEAFYRKANPDIGASSLWGFAHFVEHGLREQRPAGHFPTFYRGVSPYLPVSTSAAQDLHRRWFALDFPAREYIFADEIPAAFEHRLHEVLRADQLPQIFSEMQLIEPDIGELSSITHNLLPPFHDGMRTVHAALRGRLPGTHYDSVVCVPWVRTGGADLVAGLLAKALLRVRPDERILILRTDHPHFERANWLPPGVDCVDVSDIMSSMPSSAAENMLRVMFRGLTAKRVFNVNSRLCWATFRSHGANLATILETYSYMFCWDQTPSGRRVGYPSEFFAATAPHTTAFLTDTAFMRDELTKMYRLSAAASDRIVPICTPAQGPLLNPSIARRVLKKADPASRKLVLWGGRLDLQKRFDLVQDVARKMPDVEFRCWGAALLDAPPDLSALPTNLKMQGSFDHFDELPLDEAGAWLFTGLWEGMPTTLIELATRGVPVVASAVGGVPELIRPDTGWPVPPEASTEDYVDVLRSALSCPEEALRRAEILQKRVAGAYSETVYDRTLGTLLAAEQTS
jgi:glycosyltransferase involved in cell wall biosynthesis